MIQVKTTIICDMCGKIDEFYSTVEESVKEAEKCGWYVKNNSDEVCCPSCKSKIEDMGFLNPYQRGLIEKGIVTPQEYTKTELHKILVKTFEEKGLEGLEGLAEMVNKIQTKGWGQTFEESTKDKK